MPGNGEQERHLRLLREGRDVLQPVHVEELRAEQPDRPGSDRHQAPRRAVAWASTSTGAPTATSSEALASRRRNVISGNVNSGVEISHGTGTINNQVIGNFIGTDPTGNSASPATVNNQVGVRLEGKPDCGTKPCPPDESKETVTDNVIVNSGWGGILVDKGTHRFDHRPQPDRPDPQRHRRRQRLLRHPPCRRRHPHHRRTRQHHRRQPPGHPDQPVRHRSRHHVSSPTHYNTITRNSIKTSAGLGIDILPYGHRQPERQWRPDRATRHRRPCAHGPAPAVVAHTCAACTVELFATTRRRRIVRPGDDLSRHRVADATGAATFTQPAGGWPSRVTATATTPQGSTSEFAANIVPPDRSSLTTRSATRSSTHTAVRCQPRDPLHGDRPWGNRDSPARIRCRTDGCERTTEHPNHGGVLQHP